MSPPFLVSHSHEVFLPTMHSGWFNSLGEGVPKFMAILNLEVDFFTPKKITYWYVLGILCDLRIK